MESNLQQASASRPLPSTINIVDETPGLTGQLNPLNAEPAFTTFRAIDNVHVSSQQPLPTAQTQAIDLGNTIQHGHNDGLGLIQGPEQSFQPSFNGLEADATASTSFAGQLQGMKLIPDPPDLEYWRDRLFHVNEMITLSEEQYETPLEEQGTAVMADECITRFTDSRPTSLT